jgi:DNA sulfur modification protein DndD
MIFKELILQNFGPYQGQQTINLDPDVETRQNASTSRPIILFGGLNGGGKTTLMDAIRLALYGGRAQCSTRGNLSYSDFLTQCVNRNTPPTETARIELVFELVQDYQLTQFKIVRYWEKNPKDGKDILGILSKNEFQDEWWKDEGLTKTWDEYIETILPLGVSNLFLFDGEQVKELAEMETPPDFVVNAIKSLLGLELAERLALDLEILLSRKRKESAKGKTLATLEKIEAKFKQLAADKELAIEEQSSLQTQVNIVEKKLDTASNKFIVEGGKIAAERSQLDHQLTYLKEQTAQTRNSLVEIAGQSLPLSLISHLLEESQKQAAIEAEIHQAKAAQTALKQRSDRLLDYLTQLSLKAQQLEKIKTFIEQENQDLETQATGIPWLEADPETITQIGTLLRYEIPHQKSLATEKLDQLKTLENEIDVTDRQLATAASPEAYERLETAVREAQKEFAHVKAAYETANRRIEEINREVLKTQKELEEYSQEYLKFKNNEHIVKSIKKVQTTLSLFREKLTLKKLNKLELEITDCFRYLLHKSDLVHRVTIDTGTFALAIFDPQGQPVPKHRLSAGEKQLLAISFLWGLARVSGRHLPVAIDTPLGRLDSSHRNNLVERYFPAASHQVILLSTDTEITQNEYKKLQELEAISQEYLLKYNPKKQQTTVESGYFWDSLIANR